MYSTTAPEGFGADSALSPLDVQTILARDGKPTRKRTRRQIRELSRGIQAITVLTR